MAFSFVRDATSTPGASPYTAIFASNSAGDVLVVMITTSNNVTPNTPTDTKGNTYVLIGGPSGNTTSGFLTAWFCASCLASAGNNTVSVSFGSAPGGGEMSVQEWTPPAGTVSAEASGFNAATGSNNAPLTGNYSSSQTDDLMLSYVGLASTPSITAGNTGTPGNWSKTGLGQPDAFTGIESSTSNSTSSTNTGRFSLGATASWTIMAFALKAVSSGITIGEMDAAEQSSQTQPMRQTREVVAI